MLFYVAFIYLSINVTFLANCLAPLDTVLSSPPPKYDNLDGFIPAATRISKTDLALF